MRESKVDFRSQTTAHNVQFLDSVILTIFLQSQDNEEMECSGIDDDINDMLDEALDDSQVTLESGPTPPKVARSMSPGSSGNLTSFARAGSRFSHRKFDFAQLFMS